jgi:hypothetical protein
MCQRELSDLRPMLEREPAASDHKSCIGAPSDRLAQRAVEIVRRTAKLELSKFEL